MGILKVSHFSRVSLVLLGTFERLKQKIPDWSLFKGFLKIFVMSSIFVGIYQQMRWVLTSHWSQIWAVFHHYHHPHLFSQSDPICNYRCILGSYHLYRRLYMSIRSSAVAAASKRTKSRKTKDGGTFVSLSLSVILFAHSFVPLAGISGLPGLKSRL